MEQAAFSTSKKGFALFQMIALRVDQDAAIWTTLVALDIISIISMSISWKAKARNCAVMPFSEKLVLVVGLMKFLPNQEL